MLNPFDYCGFLKTFDDFSYEITINNNLPLQQKLLQVDLALLEELRLQSNYQQFITYTESYIRLGFVWWPPTLPNCFHEMVEETVSFFWTLPSVL